MFALKRFTQTAPLLLAMAFISGCSQMPSVREGIFYRDVKPPILAVKILETERLLVSPAGSFAIRGFRNGRQTATYFSTADIQVMADFPFIAWAQNGQSPVESGLSKVIFEPRDRASFFCLNGRRYRGALEIVLNQDKNLLTALNIVHLEDYLRGVVPAEMGKREKNQKEALKAQAIAARTYALSTIGQYNGSYDLKATIYDQVYQGMENEDLLVNQMVYETRGMVLSYQGKLIQAYYHANCGGRTENLEEVWEGENEPYLLSVDDDEFCAWAGNYRWEEEWEREDLEQNLVEFLRGEEGMSPQDFGRLTDLKIVERTPSGRVGLLVVKTDKGSFEIREDRIRWALKRGKTGVSILPSTLFELEMKRNPDGTLVKVKAVGRGNGHGIGMCQTGAIGMAGKGYSYFQILTHYYPATKILKYQ